MMLHPLLILRCHANVLCHFSVMMALCILESSHLCIGSEVLEFWTWKMFHVPVHCDV